MFETWDRVAGLALMLGTAGGAIFLYRARTVPARARARAAAAIFLVLGTAWGTLGLYYARMASRCACPSPPCYTRLGPDCNRLLTENAYTWLGVMSLVSAVVGCVLFLWLARKIDKRRLPPQQ